MLFIDVQSTNENTKKLLTIFSPNVLLMFLLKYLSNFFTHIFLYKYFIHIFTLKNQFLKVLLPFRKTFSSGLLRLQTILKQFFTKMRYLDHQKNSATNEAFPKQFTTSSAVESMTVHFERQHLKNHLFDVNINH